LCFICPATGRTQKRFSRNRATSLRLALLAESGDGLSHGWTGSQSNLSRLHHKTGFLAGTRIAVKWAIFYWFKL
jgi:hypothetical protein